MNVTTPPEGDPVLLSYSQVAKLLNVSGADDQEVVEL